MQVSIRDSENKVRKVDIKEVWVQAEHAGCRIGEHGNMWGIINEYRLLLDFGDYFHADEGCCDDPFGCDCDQETRGIVYIKDNVMFISFGGGIGC